MPWCATCDRFLSPSTVRTDGSCPTCGATVESAAPRRTSRWGGLPWHTKALIAVFAVYLGFRLVQGVVWLAGRF